MYCPKNTYFPAFIILCNYFNNSIKMSLSYFVKQRLTKSTFYSLTVVLLSKTSASVKGTLQKRTEQTSIMFRPSLPLDGQSREVVQSKPIYRCLLHTSVTAFREVSLLHCLYYALYSYSDIATQISHLQLQPKHCKIFVSTNYLRHQHKNWKVKGNFKVKTFFEWKVHIFLTLQIIY